MKLITHTSGVAQHVTAQTVFGPPVGRVFDQVQLDARDVDSLLTLQADALREYFVRLRKYMMDKYL